MESREIIPVPTCEPKQEIHQEKFGEVEPSSGSESNTTHQDNRDEQGPNTSEKNSVKTFALTSVTSKTIKVYLRLKPFPPEIDLTKEQEDAYTIINSTTLLTKFPSLDINARSLKNFKFNERVCRTFTFTTAFGPAISQIEFFDEAIKPQIHKFLDGQNSTIMSYGTSNAGKSYTLYGVPSAPGIVPLSISRIFSKIKSTLPTPWYKPIYVSHVIGLRSSDRIRELEFRDKLLSFELPENIEFSNVYQGVGEAMSDDEGDFTLHQDEHVIYSIWISFAEIYNDVIYDLLSSDCHKNRLPLKMVTDRQGRTFIRDLKTVCVNSDDQAYQILLAGRYKSHIAATTLNSRSSRSHCIFTIKLLKYYAESSPEDVKVSTLSFCDLAGSGRLKITNNIRDRLKETQNINTSLLVLGRCFKSILEGQSMGQKSEVVGPFRESKLTRLFRKALSGKEQMTLIVNVNPVPSLYAETRNVLNFSAIAKKIIVEPVKGVRKKMYFSRFSWVVSQSVKTITDWDHAANEDSTHDSYPEKVRTLDYIPRECYDDLSSEYEKLKEGYVALKTSMIAKDFEIREEMANTYTGLINNLEANWRCRSKDLEEQQEHLLAWSVSQVENFYKEKLNRLNSRKRRRWDDGDAVDDQETNIREMEAENASLTAKILVMKETINDLRSARENAFAEKNKTVFELSLVKEEIIGVKKMLEAAENDIRYEKDGTHCIHELKNQLINREERIKSLKEFLNEAKEEYIRITSDASQMREELKEANATLIEDAEKIEDLEEQLDQSNVFLTQRAKEIEQLTEKLEHQSKQLAEFQGRARTAEEELEKSEFIRLNLIGAVEDLNKLREYSSTESEMNLDFRRNVTESKESEIVSEITNIESENSPPKLEFQIKNRLKNIVTQSKGSKNTSIGMPDADEAVYNPNQNSFRLSDPSGINDSGIGMNIASEYFSTEKINSIIDTDFKTENGSYWTSSSTIYNKNVRNESTNSKLEYGESPTCAFPDNSGIREVSLDLNNAKFLTTKNTFSKRDVRRQTNDSEQIETGVRLANMNELATESHFADIGVRLEMKINVLQKELISTMEKKRCDYEYLNDKVSELEKQLSEVNVQPKMKAGKCFNEHEAEVERLEKAFVVFKELDDLNLRKKIDGTMEKDINTLSELQNGVNKFQVALIKCQTQEKDHLERLRSSLERLSFLESQIRNWSISELQNANAISTLHDLANRNELRSEVNTVRNEEEFHAFEIYGEDEKIENQISYLQSKEVMEMSKLKSVDTLSGDGSSTAIIWGEVCHLDAKQSLTANQGETSISSSNPTVLFEEGLELTEAKVFKQATQVEDLNAQSEPLEVHTTLRIREIILIIFLIIVCFVGYV